MARTGEDAAAPRTELSNNAAAATRIRAGGGSPPAGLQRPETLTGTVVTHIQEMILAGRYPPGAGLPEMTLAAELKTSRGTVREALRKLGEIGVVEVFPHRGAFVPKLSAARAREIVDLRALLESHAFAIAVREQRVTAERRALVAAAFERLQRADESGSAFEAIEADLGLHAAMAGACGRAMLIDLLATIQIRSRQFILQSQLYNAGIGSQAASHRSLIEAFYSGDPDLAAAAVDEHIRGSGARLLAKMAELGVNE